MIILNWLMSVITIILDKEETIIISLKEQELNLDKRHY